MKKKQTDNLFRLAIIFGFISQETTGHLFVCNLWAINLDGHIYMPMYIYIYAYIYIYDWRVVSDD